MLVPLYNLKFVIHSFTEIGKVIRFDNKMIIHEYLIGIARHRRGFKNTLKKILQKAEKCVVIVLLSSLNMMLAKSLIQNKNVNNYFKLFI